MQTHGAWGTLNFKFKEIRITTTKHLCSDLGGGGGADFNNMHLMTCFYNGSLVMSMNRLSLLWSSVATGSGDITSSLVATMTI
jgi:hypothetical protein